MVGVPGVDPGSGSYKEPVLPLNYTPKIGQPTRTRTGMFLYPKQAGYQLPHRLLIVGAHERIRTSKLLDLNEAHIPVLLRGLE